MSGAADRLGRLLSLVPYLLARPGARVAEVARDFGISERQLIDDLQLLFVCGLPGHLPDDLIEADFEGGVIHVSNAETIARPLRLGLDEALALLVGLRTLAAIPGLADRAALDRALAKLERAAGDAANLADHVAVEVEAESEVLARVRGALERNRRLHLAYYVPGRDEVTERDVDPMRVLIVEGRAYLEGWCRRVDDVRLFRLDRMVAVDVLDHPAEVPPEAPARDLGEGLFQPSPDDRLVILELSARAAWVADYYPCESVERLAEGRLRVRLRTPDTRWLARLGLRLGADGRVVDPPELAAEIAETASRALTQYERNVRSEDPSTSRRGGRTWL